MSRSANQREYHIAVLGSGGVGKSCLTSKYGHCFPPDRTLTEEAVQFVQGIFVERYDPTIEDSYQKHIDVDGRRVVLEIMDTAGTEQFSESLYAGLLKLVRAAMRDMYIRMGQGFLLVFSITSASSFQELIQIREEIVRTKNDPTFPIVLVGNKSDLAEDRQVSRAKAFQLSQSWGNIPYYETSARRATNIQEVFVDVCRQIIRKDIARTLPGRKRGDGKKNKNERHEGRPEDRDKGPKCIIL